MSSDDRIQLLKDVYAAWGRGDYSRGEFLHPEFELVFAPGFLDEGVFRGRADAWRGWKE
jgi:ketosteroid isomerase-like protein